MAGRRLSREAFLARAFEEVVRQGGAVLHIEALTRALGVSTGSFYWHFRDRRDFVRALLLYWEKEFTASVVDYVEAAGTDPELRFRAILDYLLEEDPARYDRPFRVWAALDTEARPYVRRVDQLRVRFVQSLFEALGHRGSEAAQRTRVFVTYFSFEGMLAGRPGRQRRLAERERLYRFFTRP